LVVIIVLIDKWIFQISNRYAISFEKPFLKLLYESSFERGNIFIKLNDLISDDFDLF
jgi:hypothetical protein